MSLRVQNVFLERSRVARQNLKFLSKRAKSFRRLPSLCTPLGGGKVHNYYSERPEMAFFSPPNGVQRHIKSSEEIGLFWPKFQILSSYSRSLPKCILDPYGRLGASETTLEVKIVDFTDFFVSTQNGFTAILKGFTKELCIFWERFMKKQNYKNHLSKFFRVFFVKLRQGSPNKSLFIAFLIFRIKILCLDKSKQLAEIRPPPKWILHPF